MAENLVKADPKAYFKFFACQFCRSKPCELLRYGGVIPGKYRFCHLDDISIEPCYFTAKSFDEIENILNFRDPRVSDLKNDLDSLYTRMSPAECLKYDYQYYFDTESGWGEYMDYIKRLWDDRILMFLRIPLHFQQDLKVRRWLHALEGGVELSHKLIEKDDLSKPAATDALIKADEKTGADNTINPETPEDVTISTVVINLAIDPEDAENHDDLFVLESTDKSYRQSKTVKDDTVEGNDTLDLEYMEVNSEVTYNLFVDHGDHGGKQIYFENIQGKDLIKNVP
jgi:hypothetical protein